MEKENEKFERELKKDKCLILFVCVEFLLKGDLFDFVDGGCINFSVYEMIVLKLGVEK